MVLSVGYMKRFFIPVKEKLLVKKKTIGEKENGCGQFDEIPLGRWPARPWPGQACHRH